MCSAYEKAAPGRINSCNPVKFTQIVANRKKRQVNLIQAIVDLQVGTHSQSIEAAKREFEAELNLRAFEKAGGKGTPTAVVKSISSCGEVLGPVMSMALLTFLLN